MELFKYCWGSRVLVERAYKNADGEGDIFVREMCTMGLEEGHANFLLDMIEAVAVDIDTMQAAE